MIARAAAALAILIVAVPVGVLAYHFTAAQVASDAPTAAAVRTAFLHASTAWRSHIDLPIHRLALTSAEEYGAGNYIFVFDVYGSYGIGAGYVTASERPGGGGLLDDGGFAGLGAHRNARDELERIREGWTRAYGRPRVVAPMR